jgi:hypothetical protein
LYYQWLHNGSPISAATNATLNFGNLQPNDSGNYSFIVSNALGIAVSSNAVVFAYAPADLDAALNNPGIAWSAPDIAWFPQTNTTHDGVCAAQSGVISGSQQSTLQGIVNGPATITYWWKVNCDSFWDSLAFSQNGVAQNSITGTVDWQQRTNYISAGAQTVQWKLYPVYAAYAGGAAWLDQVQIIPGGTAPIVTANPVNITANAGGKATFSVSANGTAPIGCKWQFNGGDISGATNFTLSISNAQTNDAGLYNAVVFNDYGSVASSNATLTINPSAPTITIQPASQTSVPNGSVTFSVAAFGTVPIFCQWWFNGSPISGATSNNLVLANLQSTNAGSYTAVLTNSAGTVTSSIAVLEVMPTAVVDCWIPSTTHSTPLGLGNIVAIAAGYVHTVGLRQDGTVAVWGLYEYTNSSEVWIPLAAITNLFLNGRTDNAVTNVPPGLSNVIAIASGSYHALALKQDGTVVAWGDNSYGQTSLPPGLSNVVAIDASDDESMALKSDGTVVGWGYDNFGQLDVPVGLTNAQTIALGYYNGFALGADGTFVQWGSGARSLPLVAPNDIVDVQGVPECLWTLHEDGSIMQWGTNSAMLTNSGVAAIAAPDYGIALRNDGTIWEVLEVSTRTPTPTFPGDLSGLVAISATPFHAAVLLNDGSPWVVSGRLVDRIVSSGSTTVFSPGIVGAFPMSYQWQCNGTNIDGQTNTLLVLTNVSLDIGGIYGCVAGNSRGVATNQVANLIVSRSTPRFSSAPVFSSGGVALQLDRLSGHGPLVLYSSPDLLNWQPILTNPAATGALRLNDGAATNAPRRFYKAVER